MCFAPQRRALFQHLKFKKCSEPGVFSTFWLQYVLRAAAASTFSTSQLPKVVRDLQFFRFVPSKCTSRHNGVHFFNISTSKSAPNLVCLQNVLRATTACNFSSLISPDGSAPAALASLLFDPPELPFRAPASSVFWLFLFSDLLSSSFLFSSLTLPTSAFSCVHTVESLTSKLPSMISREMVSAE